MEIVTAKPQKLSGLDQAMTWIKRNLVLIYPIIVIVGLFIFFTIRNANFATLSNMVNVGQQSSILLLVSLAGTIVILIGSIDLSVGAIVTLAGVVGGIVLNDYGVTLAIIAAVSTGLFVGIINGSTMLAFKVPSFLVTLGMMSVLSGVTNMICDGQSVILSNTTLTDFVNATWIVGVPNIITITLLIVAIQVFLSFKSVLGRYFFAIGGGERVAANSGVPIIRVKILAYMMSGGLAGLAGIFFAAQIGAATPIAGDALLLDSIAAIVMGGTALSGGIGGPHRTVLGVLVIALLSNGMDVTGVSSFTQQIVKGLVIILAVASTIDRRKYEFIK